MMPNRKTADVVVAHAEPVARIGLIHLINSHPQLRVCAETDNLSEAGELCAQHKPQVLLMDVAMGNGFTFIKDLPQVSSETRVVVFTAQNDAFTVQRAFQAGACAFIARHDPVSALIAALMGAVIGERHIGPQVESLLLDTLARGALEVSGTETAALSNRELQVFQLLGQGRDTRAVATELGVSVKTVATHRERIKQKLGIRTGTELQRRAFLFREAGVK